MDEQKIELSDEDKRNLRLIASLPQNEAFNIWKKTYCADILSQLENKLKNPSALSDIELRASVMHYNSVKFLLEDIFDQAKFLTKEE